MVGDIVKSAAAELGAGAVAGLERDTAITLRRIEEAARSTSKEDPRSTIFQELLIRVLAPPPGTVPQDTNTPTAAASSLIIP